MTHPASFIRKFESRDDVSAFAARKMADIIRSAIGTRGKAVILLSGGGTPRDAYAALSAADIEWDKVSIGLVDDRCVAESDPGSNQAMIKKAFAAAVSQGARIFDMVSFGADGQMDMVTINTRMTALAAQSVDLCLMGMGTDGHTASWFPGSKDLKAALDLDNAQTVMAIDAAGCPVAGDYPRRISLTLSAVMDAKHILLFITGDEKAKVLGAAEAKSVYEAPVKALLAAGPRLTTLWAP